MVELPDRFNDLALNFLAAHETAFQEAAVRDTKCPS